MDEALMLAVRDAQSIYGIDRIQLLPSLDELMVEYDATRLKPADLEAVLRRKGIPIEMIGADAA